MPDKKLINFDEILREEFGEVDESSIVVHEVELFGETFGVRQDLNAFGLLSLQDAEDTSGLMALLVNSFIPDDRRRFKSAVARQPSLTGEKLMTIFRLVLEVAAGGHPSDSSSGSERTSRKKAAIGPSEET